MKKLLLFVSLLIMVLSLAPAHAGEDSVNRLWCGTQGGQVEVVMPDNTRCDCVTDRYTIETDYAHKWYEAVGQSLHYAYVSQYKNRRPGIVLIIRSNTDYKYVERLYRVIEEYNLPIRVWTVVE